MTFDPEKHQRRSIRLKGYDYSKPGMYYLTICTQNRLCLFGNVVDKVMILNDAGCMIEKWSHILNEKYTHIRCVDFVVMPNHMHGIIQIFQTNVGADRRVCPRDVCHTFASVESDEFASVESDHHGSRKKNDNVSKTGKHIGLPLPRIVQWFKTMTTNEYITGVKHNGWHPFDKRLWQRNYYEHIIRNEKELNRVREYIRSNPAKWDTDRENPAFQIKD